MRRIFTCILVATSIASRAQHYTSVESGMEFGVALRSDSTVWVWGFNGNGQLGDGTNTASGHAKQVDTARKWISVSAGGFHRMGIASDGSLWGCGLNGNGQTGDPRSLDPNPSMVKVSLAQWKFVAAGLSATAAIQTDGSLWVAGNNYFGLLGTGDTVGKDQFTQIGHDKDWASAAVGFGHILAIKTDGTLWGWGSNANGELGLGMTSEVVWTPTQVGSATDWQSVSVGSSYSLAMKTDGSIYSTGLGDLYQLGRIVSYGLDSNFGQIGSAKNWKSISAGNAHAFAIDNGGQLFAWGANGSGQVGLPATASIPIPTLVGSDTTWSVVSACKGIYVQSVAMYGTFSSGMKKPGRVICTAGSNLAGQLGNGTISGNQSYFDCVTGEIPSVPNGVQVVANQYVRIYPNPATSKLFLEDLSGNMKEAAIFNIQGEMLEKVSGKDSRITFSIEKMQAGFYFVRIQMKDGSQIVEKFQKN